DRKLAQANVCAQIHERRRLPSKQPEQAKPTIVIQHCIMAHTHRQCTRQRTKACTNTHTRTMSDVPVDGKRDVHIDDFTIDTRQHAPHDAAVVYARGFVTTHCTSTMND